MVSLDHNELISCCQSKPIQLKGIIMTAFNASNDDMAVTTTTIPCQDTSSWQLTSINFHVHPAVLTCKVSKLIYTISKLNFHFMKTYTEYPDNYTYSSCVHRDMYPLTKYKILHIIHVMNNKANLRDLKAATGL